MEFATHHHLAIDLGFVKDAMVSVLSAAKGLTLWMGHTVIAFAGWAWDMSKAGLIKLVELAVIVWNECLPHVAKIATFLASKPGIFGMGILASVLILRMALNDDNLTDATGRRALAVIGATIAFLTGVFGAQAEFAFIPQIVAKEGLKHLSHLRV